MTKIDYTDIINGIKSTLTSLNLTYIGLYPDSMNRIGNNYPAYAIRFSTEDNNNDEYVGVISTSITMSLYIFTKDISDRVLKQNEIEEDILELIYDNPTLDTDCINNTVYINTDRGDYSDNTNSYLAGYYPNHNLEIMNFSIWVMRRG